VGVTADVFRGKRKFLSGETIGGIVLHGGTAILALFLLFKALGS
jgi:hypothetical protein